MAVKKKPNTIDKLKKPTRIKHPEMERDQSLATRNKHSRTKALGKGKK